MWIESFIIPYFEPILKIFPMVGDHNNEKVDTWRELWDFIFGFKDGVVGVTGGDSKAYLCNANLSIADKIWYTNYANMFDGTHFTEDDAVFQASMLEIMGYIQDSLQWPFFVLYNCYWAGYELYTPESE